MSAFSLEKEVNVKDERLQILIRQVILGLQKGHRNIAEPLVTNACRPTGVLEIFQDNHGCAESDVKVEVCSDDDNDNCGIREQEENEDEDRNSLEASHSDNEGDNWEPESTDTESNEQDEDSSEDFLLTGTNKMTRTTPKRTFTPVAKDRTKIGSTISKAVKVDFTGMSKFKKGVIRRTLARHRRMAQGRGFFYKKDATGGSVPLEPFGDAAKGAGGQVETFAADPSLKYYMDYSAEKDELSVQGIKITIQQDPPSLKCSECSFQSDLTSDKEYTADYRIFYHVLSRHLHVFQCPFCGVDMSSYSIYKYHINRHKNMYVCDICGKPLARKHMKGHKWTHMSAEEKAEAERKGEKNPRRKPPPSIDQQNFQCSTCGMGFTLKGNLKKHEERHLNEKKLVICPTCGKQVSEKTYKYSHRQLCEQTLVSGERPPVVCTRCPKSFKTEFRMRDHFNRCHSSRKKSFVCTVCSKPCTTRIQLKNHVAGVHSDLRPFPCSKGCGMSFKTADTLRGHVKACDGTGTRPGPKGPRTKKS